MKVKTRLQAILTLLTLSVTAIAAQAANGTWINPGDGNWSDPNNWLNGIVARGPGSTADFSTIDVPAGATITVTADVDPTTTFPFQIGNMLFGDTDPTNGVGNWVVADGGAGLILSGTTSSNSLIVVNLAQGTANNLVAGWGTATISALLDGTNTLVKAGPSPLVLNPASASPYSGGTVISNGMIYLNANNTGIVGSGPVTFYGGSLRLHLASVPGNDPSVNTVGRARFLNNIIVPTGQKGTIYMSPRPDTLPVNSGTVSGGGTLTVFADYVRGNIGGDWSAFTGRLIIASSTRQVSDLRFDATFAVSGWSNNAVTFTNNGVNGNTLFMYNAGITNTPFIEIGEMSASIPGIVAVQANNGINNGAGGSAPFILQVGALNTDASFSGDFSASPANIASGVGIIKVGTGIWTLNGQTIENNGRLVVSNGVLQIGSGTSGKLGRTPVVTNYATLAFGRSDTLVVTNIIDGPGKLEQRGAGTLILAPAGGGNTYTGKTVVTNGLLLAVPEAALGPNPASPTADQVTLNGGGLRSTNDLTFGGNNRGITLGSAGGKLSPDTNTTLTIAAAIAGSGSLTITGAGTATLTGANTYTGKTILKSGTLALASEALLGNAPGAATADQLTLDGGTLRSTATFAIDDGNRGITIGAAGGTFSPDASTTLTLTAPLAGSGPLTKSGAGTLVLNAAGTYSGLITVNQGTLTVGGSGALPGSTIIEIASGQSLDVSGVGLILGSGQTLSGNGTVLGNVTANSGSTLSAGTSVGKLTISGNLVMNGATNRIEISGVTNDVIVVNGNLTLTGINTMNLVPLATLPAGTYTLIKYSGNLTGGAGNLALTGYPVTRLTANLVVNAGNKSIDLVLSGTGGALVWTGGLAGNAWDVGTTANWLNGASKDTFFNNDSVSFTEIGSSNSTVNLVTPMIAGATINSTTDYTFSGPGKLTGLSSITKSGTGKLTVLTTNDHTAGTTISAGTLQVGNGTASGSLGSSSITDNSALTFNLPGSLTVANAIGGAGSLTVQTGSLILTGTNSYGATVINNGTTLQVGAGGASGSLGAGGVTDNGSLIFKRTGSVTNLGSIGGNGSLTVQSGTVVLAANNSYSGTTTVDTGTLQVGAGGTTGTLGTAGSVTLTNGGTVAFGRSDVFTNAVAVLGTNGTLAQFGLGTTIITNDANLYGPTLVTGGKLQLGDGVNASGVLGTGNITVTSPGTLVFNRPDEYTLTNLVSGSGSLMQVGSTNLNITVLGDNSANSNPYSGGTTISNSTIVLVAAVTAPPSIGYISVNGGALGTGTVTFLGNSTLALAAANSDEAPGGPTSTFSPPLNVPAGQTANLLAAGRCEYNNSVSGAGTLNWRVNYVRGDINGNWTNFTGTLNLIPRDGGDEFRISTTLGFPNALVVVTNGVTVYSIDGNNRTYDLGALAGDGTLGTGNGNSTGPTWRIGARNSDSTFDGVILNATTTSLTKVGTGKLTLTGANTYTGTTTVSNGVLALSTNAVGADATVGSSLFQVAAPGTFDVSGITDGTLHLGEAAAQTLRGDGSIKGKLLVGPLGIVAPGFSNSLGTLTVSGNVTNQGALQLRINATNSPNCDKLAAPALFMDQSLGFLTMDIANLGDIPPAWTTFRLLSVPYTGFVNPTLPDISSNPDLYWSNRLTIDGTLIAASRTLPQPPPVNTGKTNIVFVRAGNSLELSWPADHTGWRLETNASGVAVTNAWFTLPGSATTNRVTLPINPAQLNVFYRLTYP